MVLRQLNQELRMRVHDRPQTDAYSASFAGSALLLNLILT